MRRSIAILALVTAPLVLPGCFESSKPADVIMDSLMLLVGAAPKPSNPSAKPAPLRGSITVPTTVSIGGLSGTYDITLGTFGNFSGTTKVRGGKSVSIRDKGTVGLKSAIVGIIADANDETLIVKNAKASFQGRQTTGGVKKLFKGTITFTGTIREGQKVRGTIRTSGDLEAPIDS